jgi:hypothetical protein
MKACGGWRYSPVHPEPGHHMEVSGSLKSQLLYPQGNRLQYPLDERLHGSQEAAFYFAVKIYRTSTFLVKVEMIMIRVSNLVLVSCCLQLTLEQKVVLSIWLHQSFLSFYLTLYHRKFGCINLARWKFP